MDILKIMFLEIFNNILVKFFEEFKWLLEIDYNFNIYLEL